MKEKLLPFIKQFIPFTILLYLGHFAIREVFCTDAPFYYTLYKVYLFHFAVTFLLYLFLVFVNITFFDKTGYAFLATGILKMMASLVFLLPLIQSDFEDKIPDVATFFVPFFLFLFFETLHAVRLLNPK